MGDSLAVNRELDWPGFEVIPMLTVTGGSWPPVGETGYAIVNSQTPQVELFTRFAYLSTVGKADFFAIYVGEEMRVAIDAELELDMWVNGPVIFALTREGPTALPENLQRTLVDESSFSPAAAEGNGSDAQDTVQL